MGLLERMKLDTLLLYSMQQVRILISPAVLKYFTHLETNSNHLYIGVVPEFFVKTFIRLFHNLFGLELFLTNFKKGKKINIFKHFLKINKDERVVQKARFKIYPKFLAE